MIREKEYQIVRQGAQWFLSGGVYTYEKYFFVPKKGKHRM